MRSVIYDGKIWAMDGVPMRKAYTFQATSHDRREAVGVNQPQNWTKDSFAAEAVADVDGQLGSKGYLQ